MNEFRSPHQNININISYNLGHQQKIPKVIFANKNAKINKSTLVQQQPQIAHKNTKKVNTEPSVAKEIKDNKKSKSTKLKKKINNFFESSALRIKTEGNVSSVPKHDLKTSVKPFFKQNNLNNKSLNNPSMNLIPKNLTLKKQTQVVKAKRQQNRNNNKSCIIYPKKHILLSDVQHFVSTTASGQTHTSKSNKKRVNSVNVMRSDKFINKLLDMSVLTSQLGGTVPINDQTNKRQDFGLNKMKKSLHQFMNSVDLRIIKKMEQDQQKKGVLSDMKVGQGMELINFLQRIRRIPIDTLHLKASKIQKFWRRISSQSIVPYYSNMFFRNPMINAKALNNNNFEQISHIDVEQGQNNRQDQGGSLIKSCIEVKIPQREKLFGQIGSSDGQVLQVNQKLSELLVSKRVYQDKNVEEINCLDFSDDNNMQNKQKNELMNSYNINQDQQASSSGEEYEYENNNKNSKSLNIQKYKQLVRQTIEKSKNAQQKINKQNQFRQHQSVQLINNNQAFQINRKVTTIPHNIQEQFINQSAKNKELIQGELNESESTKICEKPFSRQFEKIDIIGVDKTKISSTVYEKQHQNDFEPQQAEYNQNKYLAIGNQKKSQQVKSNNEDCSNQQISKEQAKRENGEVGLPKKRLFSQQLETSQNKDFLQKVKVSSNNEYLDEMENSLSQNSLDKDSKQIYIRRTDEQGIVENYLDCGLSNFGLSIHGSTHRNQQQSQLNNQNQIVFSEQESDSFKLEKKKFLNSKQQLKSKYSIKDNSQHQKNTSNQQLLISQNNNKRIEVATKNRNDTINHLGYRIEQNSQVNINEFADIGVVKKLDFISDQIHHEEDECLMEKVNKRLMESALIEQESQKITLFPQIDILQQDEYFTQQKDIQDELKKQKVSKTIEAIISKLIHEFAQDVSLILRKSQANGMLSVDNGKKKKLSKQQSDNNYLVSSTSSIGVQTTFQNIRDFIAKLKEYVLDSDQISSKLLENLRNNIGPTSMEILSYLRIDDDGEGDLLQESEQQENDEWLFVIPNNLFEDFNKKLIEQEEVNRRKKLSNRFKLYIEFWHRSIFQCFNECLDYERPYGITGAPYVWVTQPKLPHKIYSTKKKTKQILQNAQSRLLQISCCSSGIIFDKQDSPYREFNLSEQNKAQLNEEKISRMLASQILDDEYNWIIYNDEMTELMVDISRKIQDLLFFQVSTQIKKICRWRKDIGMVLNNGETKIV